MAIKEYPFYLKTTVILFGLILLVYVFATLQSVFVPLAFAAFLAVLLNPLANRMEKMGASRILSIMLSILVLALAVAGVFYFLSSQIAQFGESLPMLKQKFGIITHDLKQMVAQTFNIPVTKQDQMVRDALNNSQAMVGGAVGSLLGVMSVLFLLPVYIFLLMYYKTLILNFCYEVFAEENSKKVGEVLKETKSAIQSYIVGLLIEMVIVAAMNAAAGRKIRIAYWCYWRYT